MKKIIIALLFLVSINNSFATDLPLKLPNYVPQTLPVGLPDDVNVLKGSNSAEKLTNSSELNFNKISLSNLLTIIFSEIDTRNYVLSPSILRDVREVSFRYSKNKNGNINLFIANFLESLGYEMINKNGVVYVDDIKKIVVEDYNYHVYVPKFQKSDYLLNSIKQYFPDSFSSILKQNSSELKVDSSTVSRDSVLDRQFDKSQKFLTFKYDNEKTKNKILSLLEKIDVESKNVVIKAYIYEVQYSNKDGSALGLVLSIANKKLNLNLGSQNPLDNFFKLSSNAVNLIFSQVETDNRFKLVSNPILRVKDGKKVDFSVGSDVPVLGSVSYQNGVAIQATDYRSTGLIFHVSPTIQENSIEIDFKQEISEVLNTTTGVNNSPTFTNRSLNSTFDAKQNEFIMLAGLTNNKISAGKSRPFFLPFFSNDVESKENTEILIFIEVLPVLDIVDIPSKVKNS